MNFQKEFNTNKETWDKKVAIHAKSDFYDIESFKKGKTSLNSFELVALGDVSGKSLLHLQCHFGQDTLSWSRIGAKCTGVDISEEAIKLARNLNNEINQSAQFVCCNVLDVSKHISKKFDIIYTSYGVIGWLPDLKPWAQMISERLKPDGVFYIVEFHPIAWMFDYLQEPPELKYGYHQKGVIYEEYKGTYADENSEIISKEYGWNHSLGEVVTSLAQAGLEIEFLREHDASPYNIFPGLIKAENQLYELPSKLYPLIFEVKVTKKGA
ncbi:class I SAM-dependent methyltransferase [Marixanthomonas ophiurae]|uniref:Class I SAM-dependent methyltransferase n=1 Tax=Marixanthomonas ophiurae TaxID=387659 RepID=A0A3E1QCP9_9FLAO|nr:class I SAM-dependent methyltransferase [Marixanthomonas ophiurae]RFN59874.1 class I SAM-dependent methyltransferase [Marixanthomonas ophiurae]